MTIGTISLRRDLFAAANRTSTFLWDDRSTRPHIDQSVDVVGERISRFDGSQYLMKEDVRQKRSHEEKSRSARVLDADDAGFMSSTEVAGHDLQAASRRTVIVAGVERDDERQIGLLVHAQHEVLHDRRAGKRHPFFRDTSADDARMQKMAKWIRANGTPLGAASWGKFTLCLLGLYEWKGIPPVLPAIWLLPAKAPMHPGRLWRPCRPVSLPGASLPGTRPAGRDAGAW